MATDKDEGLVGGASDIVGGATDGLRETTSGLGGAGPWHSPDSEVYHNNPSCWTGNSIAPENVRRETGDKALCGECERLNGAGGRTRGQPQPASRNLTNSAPRHGFWQSEGRANRQKAPSKTYRKP